MAMRGEKRSLLSNVYRTRKGTLLESVPLGVTTWTVPVVASMGTVVVIKEGEATLNVAAVPLKVTLVAPIRFVPRIFTEAPTLPEVGSVPIKDFRPTDKRKTVPHPPGQVMLMFAPPPYVAP